jgi:hypothetical protein
MHDFGALMHAGKMPILKRLELAGNSHRGDSLGLRAPEELLQDLVGHGVREEDVHRHTIR